jgi:hypothetical protein
MLNSTSRNLQNLWLAVLLLGAAVVASYFVIFNSARQEDRDHTQLLLAILKLEVTNEAAIAIAPPEMNRVTADTPETRTFETDKLPQVLLTHSYGDLEKFLSQQSWQLIEQLGALVKYQNPATGEKLNASCGMYSRFYMVCDLSAGSTH